MHTYKIKHLTVTVQSWAEYLQYKKKKHAKGKN